jgi:hypothetical protein
MDSSQQILALPFKFSQIFFFCYSFLLTNQIFLFIGYFMADWVLIAEAIEKTSYTREHIAWLIRQGKVTGRKGGGVWLVDLASLKEYEAKMNELGPQKHDPTRRESL